MIARDMVTGYEITTGIEFEEVSITSVDEVLIPRDELEFVKDIIAIHLVRNDIGEWVQKFSIRDVYSSAMQEMLLAKLKATGKLPQWFSLDGGI